MIEISPIQKSEAFHFIIWNANGSKFVLQWSCGPDVSNSDAVRFDVDPFRVGQAAELAHGTVEESSVMFISPLKKPFYTLGPLSSSNIVRPSDP